MTRSIRILGPAVAVLLVGFLVWMNWSGTTTSTVTSQTTAGPYLVRLGTDTVSTRDVLTLDITEGGQPAAPDTVSVEPVMTRMGHAMSPVAATPSGPGTYQARPDFSMTGQWEFTVRITSNNQMTDAVLLVTVVG